MRIGRTARTRWSAGSRKISCGHKWCPMHAPRTSRIRRHETFDRPRVEAETIEFAESIFQLVRSGDVARLIPLLERGVPANLRNDRGDTLLLMASYHGHA